MFVIRPLSLSPSLPFFFQNQETRMKQFTVTTDFPKNTMDVFYPA